MSGLVPAEAFNEQSLATVLAGGSLSSYPRRPESETARPTALCTVQRPPRRTGPRMGADSGGIS